MEGNSPEGARRGKQWEADFSCSPAPLARCLFENCTPLPGSPVCRGPEVEIEAFECEMTPSERLPGADLEARQSCV